jgi:hypothetical protein
VALRNINLIVQQHPDVLSHEIKVHCLVHERSVDFQTVRALVIVIGVSKVEKTLVDASSACAATAPKHAFRSRRSSRVCHPCKGFSWRSMHMCPLCTRKFMWKAAANAGTCCRFEGSVLLVMLWMPCFPHTEANHGVRAV